jgi:hypothetical protein
MKSRKYYVVHLVRSPSGSLPAFLLIVEMSRIFYSLYESVPRLRSRDGGILVENLPDYKAS